MLAPLLALSPSSFAYTLTLTATPNQTIGAQPYQADHFYYSDGLASYAHALDDQLSNVGQYTHAQISITPETGDPNRVEEITVTLQITVTRNSPSGSGCVHIVEYAAPHTQVIEHCDVSATVPILLKTNTLYNIEVNAAANHLGEILDEAHLLLPVEHHAPTFTCQGFDAPLDSGAVTVRKSRALPLKAQLLDDNAPVTQAATAPRLQVLYSDELAAPVDVTDEALPTGESSQGNQFAYSDGAWRYNLSTKNYTAKGTYLLSLVSGDQTEYLVDPPCSAAFFVK